jgi:hypothetical protein
VTPRGFTTTLVELITSSRGPDQQLQRRQRVYRYLGVQQALVLVQIEMKLKLIGNIVVLLLSVEKYYFRPFWSLTYSN